MRFLLPASANETAYHAYAVFTCRFRCMPCGTALTCIPFDMRRTRTSQSMPYTATAHAAPVRRYTISIQSVIRLKVVRLFGFIQFHSLVFFCRNSLRVEVKEEKKSRNGKYKIVNDSRAAYRDWKKFQIILNGLKLIYGDHRSIGKLCYSERKSTRWAKLRPKSNQIRLFCVVFNIFFFGFLYWIIGESNKPFIATSFFIVSNFLG